MPCVGEARVLMIAVSFPDAQHGFSAEEIQNMCFGPEDPQSPRYPVESIGAFYSRSSYGRLNLTGKVYTYTAKYEIDAYTKTNYREPDYRTRDDLLDEALEALDDIIDYNDFDVNKDGILDSVILTLPKEAMIRDSNKDGKEDWVPCSCKYNGNAEHDGVKLARMCIGARDLSNTTKFNSSWIHELCHAMGLPDYYKVITNKSYDRTNKKQRVLRIINYRNMYFNDGKVINNETDGFAWYSIIACFELKTVLIRPLRLHRDSHGTMYR